jgi:menaquinone-dependent protoporphyrinogen IX oxidase
MKAFVVYDSKYGNTKQVAENILDVLRQTDDIEAAIGYAKEVSPQNLAGYDVLIIGGPNHMGKPSRTITRFVDSLRDATLSAKWFAAFDTYFQRQRYYQKAMKKLEKHITEEIPNLTQLTPGLSVRVKGVNGPLVDGELIKAIEFGKTIAAQLKQRQ